MARFRIVLPICVAIALTLHLLIFPSVHNTLPKEEQFLSEHHRGDFLANAGTPVLQGSGNRPRATVSDSPAVLPAPLSGLEKLSSSRNGVISRAADARSRPSSTNLRRTSSRSHEDDSKTFAEKAETLTASTDNVHAGHDDGALQPARQELGRADQHDSVVQEPVKSEHSPPGLNSSRADPSEVSNSSTGAIVSADMAGNTTLGPQTPVEVDAANRTTVAASGLKISNSRPSEAASPLVSVTHDTGSVAARIEICVYVPVVTAPQVHVPLIRLLMQLGNAVLVCDNCLELQQVAERAQLHPVLVVNLKQALTRPTLSCRNVVSLGAETTAVAPLWRELLQSTERAVLYVSSAELPRQLPEEIKLNLVMPSLWTYGNYCRHSWSQIRQIIPMPHGQQNGLRLLTGLRLSVVIPSHLPSESCRQIHLMITQLVNSTGTNVSIITKDKLACQWISSEEPKAWYVSDISGQADVIRAVLANSFALVQPAWYDAALGPLEGIALAVGTPVLVLSVSSSTQPNYCQPADRDNTVNHPTQWITVAGVQQCTEVLHALAMGTLRIHPSPDLRYYEDYIRAQWQRLLQVPSAVPQAPVRRASRDVCRMASCFNWMRCVRGFSFFLEPLYEPMSAWTWRLVHLWQLLKESEYRVDDEASACVTFAAIDFFNDRFYTGQGWRMMDKSKQRALWDNGNNNLIWAPQDDPFAGDFGNAILLRASTASNFRSGFDISIPMYMAKPPVPSAAPNVESRKYLACFKGTRYNREGVHVRNALRSIHNGRDIMVLTKCAEQDRWPPQYQDACEQDAKNYNSVTFEEMMHQCTFTLAPRGAGTFSYRVFEALAYGSVPVILSDSYVPPFQELITWSHVALHLPEAYVPYLPAFLRTLSVARIKSMQEEGLAAWRRYMKDYGSIVNTTLSILISRVEGKSLN